MEGENPQVGETASSGKGEGGVPNVPSRVEREQRERDREKDKDMGDKDRDREGTPANRPTPRPRKKKLPERGLEAVPRIHPYVAAVSDVTTVRDRFCLKSVFGRESDRSKAVNAIYYMSELQRSRNELVQARDHTEFSAYNHRLLLEHSAEGIADLLLIPPCYDVNQAVDLLDQ
ncbi:hypothetical protein B484DRAFT_392328, partial [Ochromonadaceae sp. CCMP2298]